MLCRRLALRAKGAARDPCSVVDTDCESAL